MKKSVENTEHYFWDVGCSGWHLVKTDELSVIQELMPPGTKEEMHFHRYAQQFFYILRGMAVFEVEGEQITIPAQSGMHIQPGMRHQFRNETTEDLHFLVISQPTSRGDLLESGNRIETQQRSTSITGFSNPYQIVRTVKWGRKPFFIIGRREIRFGPLMKEAQFYLEP